MKYVVISVDDNPQYLFYLPLVVFAWRKLGWEPILFFTGRPKFVPVKHEVVLKYHFSSIDGYRSDTIAQVSRLYAGCLYLNDNPMIMTSDIDMLPLCGYWNPNPEKITTYGHDLTGFEHYPICYIAMTRERWIEVMGLRSADWNAMIKRDLDKYPQAKADFDPVKRWVVDQDMITEKINQTTFAKENVSRGTLPNGYPVGRVDRSAWTLKHDCFIDCHMPREIYSNPETMDKMLELLSTIWPEESWEWFIDYTQRFKLIHEL